jgi:hypothetical protein
MGFKNFFKFLLSNRETPLFFKVKCSRCGEIITIRVNVLTDLENLYDSLEKDEVAFKLRKEILGKNCQNLMMLIVDFDRKKKIISQEIKGGKLIFDK